MIQEFKITSVMLAILVELHGYSKGDHRESRTIDELSRMLRLRYARVANAVRKLTRRGMIEIAPPAGVRLTNAGSLWCEEQRS